MTYFRILSLVALFSTAASAQVTLNHIYAGMQDSRRPGFETWQSVQFNEDHSWGRSADQPSHMWQNITIPVPYGVFGIQLTAVDSNGYINRAGGRSADIPFYSVDRKRSRLDVSVVWWGTPWTLFIGYSASDKTEL